MRISLVVLLIVFNIFVMMYRNKSASSIVKAIDGGEKLTKGKVAGVLLATRRSSVLGDNVLKRYLMASTGTRNHKL